MSLSATRGVGGRLEDNSIPRRQGWADLVDYQQERIVEGSDGQNNPQGTRNVNPNFPLVATCASKGNVSPRSDFLQRHKASQLGIG